MDMIRVTARWDGFTGSPGYTNFFFAGGGGLISDAQQIADRTRTAMQNLFSFLPQGTTIRVQDEVAVLDSDSGEIQAYETIDAPDPVNGGTRADYAGPVGAVVNWRTDDVRFGRRIRGRTFLVPLVNEAFDSVGSLTSDAREAVQDFASGMTNWDFDSEFGIWSRPRNGEGGVFATVTNYNVPDFSAVLRSRRD